MRDFIKRYRLLLLSALCLGLLGYLWTFNPTDEGLHYPLCPFRAITGWLCAGCGSLSALHDLLHLNFEAAFAHNPLLIVAFPYLLLAFLTEHYHSLGRWRQIRQKLFGPTAILLCFFVVIAYTIIRNHL